MTNDSKPKLTSTVELPPDQSLRVVADKDLGKFLLLSVADDPIRFGKGSFPYDNFYPYTDVQIFAESIAFTGNLLSPHGISLSCNDVIIVDPVEINTTGSDGANQVVGGSDAKPGNDGGPINFYIQSGSEDASKRLLFVTNGGKGGDYVIEKARGGNGGNGGHLIRIFQSRYSATLGGTYEILKRKDAGEEYFDKPVRDTDPIYLSTFQLLTIALKAMAPEQPTEVYKAIQALDTFLSSIKKGTTSTVKDLVIRVKAVRNRIEDFVDLQKDKFQVAASFEGGYGGSGKGIPGTAGTKGKNGSDGFLFFSTYKPDIGKTTFAFAHPEQCAMLLERAKVYYYMGSPQLRLQAEILFQRLVNRLSFLPTPPPPKPFTTMSSNSLSQLESIKKDASNWLMQLATGVGFNGHPDNWAPRASYTFYKDMLDNALADHAAFEKAYIAYHTALSKQEKLTDSVGLALQRMSQMMSSLEANIKDLAGRLQETGNRIVSLTDPVKNTHAELQKAFDRLKDQIKDDFELSVPQLVNALRSLAFSPTKGMAAVEGINLLYEGFTSVPDVEGRPANKDYLIRKIERGEATVKSIKDTLGKEIDGEFKIDDPFGTRLMTAEDDMMSFLDAYATSSFIDVIDEIKDKFDAFVKAIVARNEQAILYNIQLKLYVSKIASKADYEKKAEDLKGKEIEIHDPNLPSITAYMGDIYQSSRARVMQILEFLVRSLNYRTLLADYDIFHLAFEGSEPNKVPLTITSNVLLSGRSRIQNEFGKVVEIWGSEPARFPPNFDKPGGKRILLTESERSKLIKDHHVIVKIPPVYKKDGPGKKNDFSGLCNIRIYRVRFSLTGLVAKETARLSATLTHSGGEIIVDRNNLPHRFIHDAITTSYSFRLYPSGKIEVLDDGNIAGLNVDETVTTYAAPGPFADEWKVDLTNSDLVHLDFSNVTEAYFDFCGTNYAFPT